MDSVKDGDGTFSVSSGQEGREGSGPLELAYLNLVRTKPGTLVNGRYRLEKLVGQGGFGIVFEAVDLTLGSRLAVKFLDPRLTRNEQKFLRVRREINLSRKISDGRIIKVFSLESWQGIHFLVMELAAGINLKSYLQERGRCPWADFKGIFLQILEAVDVLHRGGIVHRDLKPSNILIDGQRQVKILDFGLAKEIEDAEKTSTAGEIVGSPYYMSPEQIRGEAIDCRSDVYQLGLILYRALSGRHPFEHTSTMDVIFSQLNRRPEPLADIDGGLPRFLRLGLDKALEKKPARRFRDAGAMAHFFEKESVSWPKRVLFALSRGPVRWSLAALALAALGFLAYRATFGSRRIHDLVNAGSRLEARNRLGVPLWRRDFSPFTVYLAYPTRCVSPAVLGSNVPSLDRSQRLSGHGAVVALLTLPEVLRFPRGLSIASPDLFCRWAILDDQGKTLVQEPFLKEHEFDTYDYIRVVKPNTVKLLGMNAKGEMEALITVQQFQSMFPFAMVYTQGIRRYVFTHPGTFEVFPQRRGDPLAVFMLFGINNRFAHMSFIAEIGFNSAVGADGLIKGIPNSFSDTRNNIPYEDKLYILPAGARLLENHWREGGRARFNEVIRGDTVEIDRAGRMTVRTKNGTFSYRDPPGTLGRVYMLVNAGYQEKLKKHNLQNALDLIGQANSFSLQNPYLRSALLYLQGDLEVGLGRYGEGKGSLERALDLYPGNNDANERLCEMDMLRGDPQAALDRLTGTYSDGSEFWGFGSFGVNLFKCYLYLHTGMFSRAEDELARIRLTLPEMALYCRAVGALFAGDDAAALAAARELENGPLGAVDLRELRLLLGRALLLNDADLQRAKFLFDDVARNSLEFGHLAEISSCYLLAREERAEEAGTAARQAFPRLLARARGDFMARLWLFYDAYVYGRVMELAGDRAEGVRGYRASIAANPHSGLAGRSRQRLAFLAGRG